MVRSRLESERSSFGDTRFDALRGGVLMLCSQPASVPTIAALVDGLASISATKVLIAGVAAQNELNRTNDGFTGNILGPGEVCSESDDDQSALLWGSDRLGPRDPETWSYRAKAYALGLEWQQLCVGQAAAQARCRLRSQGLDALGNRALAQRWLDRVAPNLVIGCASDVFERDVFVCARQRNIPAIIVATDMQQELWTWWRENHAPAMLILSSEENVRRCKQEAKDVAAYIEHLPLPAMKLRSPENTPNDLTLQRLRRDWEGLLARVAKQERRAGETKATSNNG